MRSAPGKQMELVKLRTRGRPRTARPPSAQPPPAGQRADGGAFATQTRYRSSLIGRHLVVYSTFAREAIAAETSRAGDESTTTRHSRVRICVTALSVARTIR